MGDKKCNCPNDCVGSECSDCVKENDGDTLAQKEHLTVSAEEIELD